MKKTYCKHTDACMDGVYCKAGHGESYGYCKYFPDDQVKCQHYESDRVEKDPLELWKPGSSAFCEFGGQVYRVKIRAVGMVLTEKSKTYHVQYLVPVGNTFIKVNWLTNEKRGKLFKTRREAFMSMEEEPDKWNELNTDSKE